MATAWMFPGQGSQVVGMGQELIKNGPRRLRSIIEEANDTLNFGLGKLMAEGPIEELTLTHNAQPALLTVGVLAAELMKEEGKPLPAVMLGHSLGEYTALVAASCLPFAQGIKAVRARGLAMQEAVPAGQGAMLAVLGVEDSLVEEVCVQISSEGKGEFVQPANYNAPGQLVVSGHAGAVGKVASCFTARGVKARCIPLNVSAPFHCQLMAPAALVMEKVLQQVAWGNPAVPVITNVDALWSTSDFAPKLVKQVTGSVRWTQSVRLAKENGIDRFIELGVGKVLSGLVKKILPEATAISVSETSHVKELVF